MESVQDTTQGGQEAFINTLQKKMLEKSEMVSSSPTGIDAAVKEAAAGITTAQEKSAQRINSEFGREFEFQSGQFKQTRDTELEERRGFATNTAALRNLDERTEKSLK